MKILAINGSSRDKGNTEYLLTELLQGIESTTISLRDYNIHPITDQRHDPQGFQDVNDDYDEVIQLVLNHDLLIFATPLYWYSMSGYMKNFVDRWSQSLRDPRYDFRKLMSEKKAFVTIVGGERVHLKALPLVQQFQLIFDFMSMEFLGYMIGNGTKPGTIKQDQRVAQEIVYWNQQFRRC